MEGPRLLLNRDEKTVGGDIAKGLAPGRRLLHVVGRYVVTGDMTDSFVSQTTASGRGVLWPWACRDVKEHRGSISKAAAV